MYIRTYVAKEPTTTTIIIIREIEDDNSNSAVNIYVTTLRSTEQNFFGWWMESYKRNTVCSRRQRNFHSCLSSRLDQWKSPISFGWCVCVSKCLYCSDTFFVWNIITFKWRLAHIVRCRGRYGDRVILPFYGIVREYDTPLSHADANWLLSLSLSCTDAVWSTVQRHWHFVSNYRYFSASEMAWDANQLNLWK